jgi:hypothetical protein
VHGYLERNEEKWWTDGTNPSPHPLLLPSHTSNSTLSLLVLPRSLVLQNPHNIQSGIVSVLSQQGKKIMVVKQSNVGSGPIGLDAAVAFWRYSTASPTTVLSKRNGPSGPPQAFYSPGPRINLLRWWHSWVPHTRSCLWAGWVLVVPALPAGSSLEKDWRQHVVPVSHPCRMRTSRDILFVRKHQ